MTVAEAARILEVAPRVVYDLCAAGRLGHIRIGVRRGTIRITQADLDRYIAGARIEPRTPTPNLSHGSAPGLRSITAQRLAAPLPRHRGDARS